MSGLRPTHVVLLVAILLGCTRLSAADARPARPTRVAVEPARTSIYVGTVSLAMPPFIRRGTTFESTYDCKVFPYFFSNEHGTLRIEVSDADLDQLREGRSIDFRGQALNHRRTERAVEGRATPETPTEGRLKVKVHVSRRIELIFNTRYRLEAPVEQP